MEAISLSIDKELLKSMKSSVTLLEEDGWELLIIKGDDGKGGAPTWSISMLDKESIDELKCAGYGQYASIQGEEILIVPFEERDELEGKYLGWVGKKVELINSV